MSHNIQTSPLVFGNRQVAVSTTARWLTPGYSNSTAPTQRVEIPAPRDGYIQRLRVRHGIARADAVALIYTVRLENVDQSLVVALLGNVQNGADLDLDHGFTVLAGQLLAIVVTKAAEIVSTPLNITASLELV